MDQTAGAAAARKRTTRQALREFLTYSGSQKIKAQEIILFCRQLASFVRVGIPVTTAIKTFAEQATSTTTRQVYTNVVSDLDRGIRISESLARYPHAFPAILVDMI